VRRSPDRRRARLARALVTAALVIALAEARSAAEEDPAANHKAGPVLLQLRVGPAIGVKEIDNQAALALDAGIAVDRSRNAYVLLSVQLQIERALTIVQIPIGFEYDFALPSVKGLYLYPRLSLGYAAFVPGTGPTLSAGVVTAEFGVKYVIGGRWSIGLEPLSVPLFFDRSGYSISYRILCSIAVSL
jgi:hypothetical protein